MPIPNVAATYLQYLETEIRSADISTSQVLLNNAKTYANSIRAYVSLSSEADRTLTRALEGAAALAAAYRQFGMMGSASKGAIEGIRQQALDPTARLWHLLENAELSEDGRALFG